MWNTGVLVIFGVLTTDTIEQAIEPVRKWAIKADCVAFAIEMANLAQKFYKKLWEKRMFKGNYTIILDYDGTIHDSTRNLHLRFQTSLCFSC